MRSRFITLAHPWVELLVAFALLLSTGWLNILAALAALSLMVAYLVIVIVLRQAEPETASCACFGGEAPLTRASIWRNVSLVAVAIGALAASLAGRGLADGVLAESTAPFTLLVTGIGVLAAIGAIAATILSNTGDEPVGSMAAHTEDYVRVEFPAIPVLGNDGGEVLFSDVAKAGPILVMFAAPDCRACGTASQRTPAWTRMFPFIRIFHVSPPLTDGQVAPDFIYHAHKDPGNRLQKAAGINATPGAVIIGTDGLTVGGPVYGADEIGALLYQVSEAIEIARG